MKLFNKCKVCGENVGLFNTELENPNDWAYDDYEQDKARDYIIYQAQFNLPSHKVALSYDAHDEKQVYPPYNKKLCKNLRG